MRLSKTKRQNITISTVLVLIVVALIGVSNGNVGAAIVPPLAIAVMLAVIYLPLRHTVTAFWLVILLVNDESHVPAEGLWVGPLTVPSKFLYGTLRHITGIGAFKFNLIEVGLFMILFIMGARTMLRNNIDRHLTYPAARPMKMAAFVSLGAVLFTEFWGIATGGNLSESLWQVRALFWFPFILMICLRTFKTDQDIRRLGVGLAIVCLAHVAEGTYFYFTYVLPTGADVEYVMTHFDTVWLVTLVVVLISTLVETLKRRALWNLIIIGSIVMWGLVINDRRLAFVSLALSIMIIVFFVQDRIRRWVLRAGLISLPIIVVYFVIGMSSDAAIFAPVHSLTSVTDDTDVSNWCRNVENYDLIKTLQGNPLIGTGWGHEYDEVVVAVVYGFAYRYRPHNSMMALLAFTGAIGFYLIWIYLPVGVFLANRVYHTAQTPLQRTTAITAMGVVVIYMCQCYGDLGLGDIDIAIVVSTSLACVANVVTRTGGLEEPKSDVS